MRNAKIVEIMNYEPPIGEINTGEKIVDDIGYVPADVKIRDMINAGIRLRQSRREDFDVEGDITDDQFNEIGDITRSPGFDMADASQAILNLNNKIGKRKVSTDKEVKEVKKEEET